MLVLLCVPGLEVLSGHMGPPTLAQAPSLLGWHPSSVRSPHVGVGSGQLVRSLKHLHEEGVDGGVTNELEEKQML